MTKKRVSTFILIFFLGSCWGQKDLIPQEFFLEMKAKDLKTERSQLLENGKERRHIVNYKGTQSRAKLSFYPEIDEAEAQGRAKDRVFFVTSLYKTQVSPYPDRLSNVIACESLPQEEKRSFEGGWIRRVQLWANDRYSFGSCDIKQQTYLSLILMIYCQKRRSYFELEYFLKDIDHSPDTLDQAMKLESSIRCL